MSTIYTFHEECPDLGAPPAADDELLIYDTSAGRAKNISAEMMRSGPVDLNAGTSAANILGYGHTTIGSTVGTVVMTAPPTQGVTKTISFASSTGTRIVLTSGAEIVAGSTSNPSAAVSITVTGTTVGVSAGVSLVSLGTTAWAIVGQAGSGITST